MKDYKSMNKNIEKQVRFWHERKNKIDLPERLQGSQKKDSPERRFNMPFVTISREYGCGGFEVAQKISEILNTEYDFELPWAAYDKQILEKVMDDMGLSQCLGNTLTDHARASLTEILQTAFGNFPSQVTVHKKLVETVILLAENGHVIIVGRAANVYTREIPKGFHIRLVAPLEWRVDRISYLERLTKTDAKKMILEKTKLRDSYVKKYVKFDLADPHNYDLVINNSLFSEDQVARFIIEGMATLGLSEDL